MKNIKKIIVSGLLYCLVSNAQVDHAFIGAKNDFLKAVESGDWDKAQGSFSFIEGNLEKAGPALVSILQNKLKDALLDDDFESANMLVKWVAKLPKDTNMMSLHSELANKLNNALKENKFDVVEMTAEVVGELPSGINLNAVMSTWSNKLIDALNSGNHEQAQQLAKAVSVLLEGTNINAVASTLRNQIANALESNDHRKAEELAKVSSHLPGDTNMMSVLSTLANRTMNAVRQDNIEQAIDEAKKEAVIADFLPEKAKQQYFNKSLLPELARQIGAAYQEGNFDNAKKWGEWLAQVKEYATTSAGQKAVEAAEKYLNWAQKKVQSK